METSRSIVILADDERCIRMLAARALVRAGFTVVEAVDAEEALDALVRHGSAVRALMTDICMPGDIDGLELAALAREMAPQIGILVSSGTITPGPGMLPAGGRFLHKPYDLHDLTAEVSRLAGHAGAPPAEVGA